MMQQKAQVLSATPSLVVSLIAMVVLMQMLQQTGTALGGMLDLQLTGDAARALLMRLTPSQREVHGFATAIYDSLYPLAYGAFFIGLALRVGGRMAGWVVPVMLAGMAADYVENAIQLMALWSGPDLLGTKSVITPLKFALTGFAILGTLLHAMLALLAKLRN